MVVPRVATILFFTGIAIAAGAGTALYLHSPQGVLLHVPPAQGPVNPAPSSFVGFVFVMTVLSALAGITLILSAFAGWLLRRRFRTTPTASILLAGFLLVLIASVLTETLWP
jgi:hypothetical protein